MSELEIGSHEAAERDAYLNAAMHPLGSRRRRSKALRSPVDGL